jgi:hypothetical protein
LGDRICYPQARIPVTYYVLLVLGFLEKPKNPAAPQLNA